MPTQLGIDNLKEPLKWGIETWKDYESIKEGGIKGSEFLVFLDNLLKIPVIISKGPAILAEAKDLDSAEVDELVDYAIAELGLDPGKAREKVTAVLQWLGSTVVVYLAFKKEPVTNANPPSQV